ncbi:MAG: hypothetical protein EOO45_12505 [Flavobacterium sp.]|nr:MAG: hypothetical protein EOO45_12505 [Flavobacterium sp.]
MSTLEIKKELHDLIDKGDEATVKGFYNILMSYLDNAVEYKLLEESENDIREGKIFSIGDTRNIVENWRKS